MEVLPKVITSLVLLLNDSNVTVVKKVMLCITQLYRLTLQVQYQYCKPTYYFTFFSNLGKDQPLIGGKYLDFSVQ